MPAVLELCEEAECSRLEAFLTERLYEFNAQATGYNDAKLLGGRLIDKADIVLAAFSGHTWGGCCVLSQLWVHESHRDRGLGRALLLAAESEALRRGCRQIILSSHSFQAPGFYAHMGYCLQAVVHDHPSRHTNSIYAKQLTDQT